MKLARATGALLRERGLPQDLEWAYRIAAFQLEADGVPEYGDPRSVRLRLARLLASGERYDDEELLLTERLFWLAAVLEAP